MVKLLLNLMLTLTWLLTLVVSISFVAALMSEPSTISVVAGLFIGVFLCWVLYGTGNLIVKAWRNRL